MQRITIVTTVWLNIVACNQLFAANPSNSLANVRWPAPVLTDGNLAEWLTFIRPTAEELKWRKVRWHTSLASAVDEARQLRRPVLLWTMNGNPCGET